MARLLLLVTLVPLSWLGMQIVHELGHVIHAWLSGAVIRQVLLHPLEISRTELGLDPHPLFVAWGGFMHGCLLPVVGWMAARRRASLESVVPSLRFFAGFCLAANGIYFIAGTLDPGADPGDILALGCPAILLLVAGALAFGAGLALWNGQAKEFGLGPGGRPVDARVAAGTALLLVLVVAAELVCRNVLFTD